MDARLLVLLVLPAVAFAPTADAQGCTPCECGVAYCEDGVTHWPVIEWIDVPEAVVAGEPFEVAWRFTFDPPRHNETPVRPWRGGQAFVAANATHPGPEPATYPRAYPVHVNSSEDLVFPSEHRAELVLASYDGVWLMAASDFPRVNATPVFVVVMPHADPPEANETTEGPGTRTPEGPTERVDGIPTMSVPIAAAAILAMIMTRRVS